MQAEASYVCQLDVCVQVAVPRITYLTADALVYVTGDDWRSRRAYNSLATLANAAAAAASDPRRSPALLLISRPAAVATSLTAVAGDVTDAFFRLHETASASATGTAAYRPAGLFSSDQRRGLSLRDRFRDVAVFCLPQPAISISAATNTANVSVATSTASSKSASVAAISVPQPAAGKSFDEAHEQGDSGAGR
jgi:hypothetical protein